MLAGALFSGSAVLYTFTSLTQSSRSESLVAAPKPTRAALLAFEPTKFARLLPTDTPEPTDTATAIPTETSLPTLTSTRTSTRKPDPPTPTLTPTAVPTETPAILSAQVQGGTGPCQGIPGESYAALSPKSGHPSVPADQQADLNLGLRGYEPTIAYTGFVDLDGATDPISPQLPGLFSDNRTPNSKHVYQVFDWDWNTNTRAGLITYPPVTLVGVQVAPGEVIRVPDAGNNIGLGYAVLVLYAAPNRITLKYTLEDNVQRGYTIQLEGVCVEPGLLALYQQLNAAGRSQLPALRAGQALGRANGDELGIATRDVGSYLDPRSRKDWWRGR